MAGAAASAAGAAGVPGWRITTVLRHCGDDSLSSVVATGPRDAWALGEPPWSTAAGCSADVEHWDGATWQRIPAPASIVLGDALSLSLAASSASDAWIFPVRRAQIGVSFYAYNYALHWTGKAWHASDFPGKPIVGSVADLGAGDVWAFGATMLRGGATAPYAAHYDGRAWRQVKLPVVPMATGRAGRGGLWVIGPTLATVALPASRQSIVAMYWNGRSWRSLAVPKVKVPAGQSSFFAASLAAAGPRDLWWSYRADNAGSFVTRNGLLHWNGTSWHAIAVPAAFTYVDAMTQDGHGGIWLAVSTGLDMVQYWYHYHGGHWTKTLVTSPKGYGNSVFGMAWIPGTTSIWADGQADANTATHTVGTIAKYGT
jgi:hypothetical protein